ncbi:MAG: hypothetical protein OXM62_10000, partial [bacterium]|nr:hypothetical protein [bacterium]
MRPGLQFVLGMLMALAVFLLVSCSDGQDADVQVVDGVSAGETEAVDGGDAAAPLDASIVDRLKRNADQFKYSIGRRGGTLTIATISEPLTFNLAISNDSSSSNVLGYVFEGLTETSWLTDL